MRDATATAGLSEAHAHCDNIARRDKPHLYSASRFFVHRETRQAFASTYASMRVVDDFVDDIPFRSRLSAPDRASAEASVELWLNEVRRAGSTDPSEGPIWLALSDTFSQFNLPLDPWEDLAVAMKADLQIPQFEDWNHLHRYMRGASIAPAIVFMHLVLTRPDPGGKGFLCPWPYRVVAEATADLAVFCYLVHILRDVSRDLSLGGGGLIYLPLADLKKFGLTSDALHVMKNEKRANDAYRRLAAYEAERARHYLELGRRQMPEITKVALPEHAMALNTLVETYESQLAWLQKHEFDVFAGALELTDLTSPHDLPHD